MLKKLLSVVLAVTMLFTLSFTSVAVTADPASATELQSGSVDSSENTNNGEAGNASNVSDVASVIYATITTYISYLPDVETAMPIAEFTNVGGFLNELTQLGLVGSGNLTRVVIDIKQDITSADALKIVTEDYNGNQVDVPVTINGNGHTINGSILIPNADVTINDVSIVNSDSTVSAIEINAGKLTLNEVNVSSARHAVRIDGDVDAIINSGNYSVMGTPGMTTHVVNASAGTVTINGGTFTGVKGTAGDSGTTVLAQGTANVTINGGDFSGASSGYGTEPVTATTGTITVYGGTFDQNPAAYVAEGYEYDSTTGKVTFTVTGLRGSGTEEDAYLIGSLEELIWFRDNVNTYTSDGSNQYKGKYVKLTANIDLAGINWTPIGTNEIGDHMAFLGTFDGAGHTISNLYINSDGDHLGFFARVGSYAEGVTPTVKNLTFHNVDVSSNTTTGHGGSYVGGVIANAGGNSVVSGITVTGDVYVVGYGYVGGIVGHGYPDLTDCHVTANEGSYLNCYYWCAGGIIGYAGEGGTPITNCSVSGLDIWSAYGAAAAVAGLLQDGNTLTNVSASNVEITSASDYVMGYIAGNGEASTLTNVTATNVTATANGKDITSTDAVATANGKLYFDIFDAFYENRGEDELTVVLLCDVTYDAALTVANSGTVYVQVNGEYIKKNVAQKTILDLNGKTFTGTVSDDAALKVLNGASLTITDSVGNGKIVAAHDGVKVGGGGSAATLTVEAGTIKAANVAVDVTKNSVLNVNGGTVAGDNYGAVLGGNNATINVTDGILSGNTGISSNSAYANTVGNISGGTVQGVALAIYQPQNGTTTISGGTVTGATAINVKSGTLNVTGGTVSGTGTHADHNFTGGTFASTGDAIVIENAYNYNNAYETPVVSISGGTITSDNAAAVTSYSSGNESDIALTGFITGGTFSSDVSALCADGFETVANGDGTWTVKEINYVAQNVQTGKRYEDVSDALAAAKAGETVQLLKDYTETDTIFVINDVTLDLNGKVLTIANYFASFGNVVDNSTEKTGLLKVTDRNHVMLSKTNSQMPVWNGTDGYVFANMKMQVQVKSATNDAVNIMFKPSFGIVFNSALFADGMADNDVKVVVRMTWDEDNGMTGSEDIEYSEDLIKKVYAENSDQAFTFTASGLSVRTNVKFTVVVISELGIEAASDTIVVPAAQ